MTDKCNSPTDKRCINWPCQGIAGHPGPCGTSLCDTCNEHPCAPGEDECHVCRNLADERAYDRDMSEPTFRGREYEASVAAEQAHIQRTLK